LGQSCLLWWDLRIRKNSSICRGQAVYRPAGCLVVAPAPITGTQLWAFNPHTDSGAGYAGFCQSRCSFRGDTGKSSQRRPFLRTSGAALVWCCPCRTRGPDCAPGWQLNAEIVALSGTSISRSSNRNSGTWNPGNKSRFLRRYTGKPAGFVAPVRHLCRGGTLSNEGKSARMKDSTGSAQACKG
jgi:hypothetical protein